MRRPLLLLCLCLVAVMGFGYYVKASPGEDDLPNGREVIVTGRIYQKNDTSFYLILQNIAAASRQENPKAFEYLNRRECRLLCESENAEEELLGSLVVVRGTFEMFSRAGNPGEFDYRKYYGSLGLTGRVRDTEILERGEDYNRMQELLYRIKRYWRERLYRVFPEKEASIMTAVLLGDKSNLDTRVRKLYASNGVIHILSISGLHITVIGLGLYRLLRRLGVPVWPAAILGGTVLVLYGIMTGLSVSACRAIGMYLLRMFAALCGRTYDMLTALGILAVFVMWRNPGSMDNMGFWLSFGSIFGIGILCPVLTPTKEERPPRAGRRLEGSLSSLFLCAADKGGSVLWQGFLASLSVTLTTLPIQLWFSYEVPVYSVFLNLLILPFMGAVMAAGLIAMLVPGLGIVGTVDVLILLGYEKLCVLFEKLPFHTWTPGRPAVWQIILYYILWLAVVFGTKWYRQLRKKGSKAKILAMPGRIAALKCLILTAAVICMGIAVRRGDRITFLDVGQGDCICVQLSEGQVYLFDCGSSSRSRIGERVLIPFLKYYGISHVDAVFLSHSDSDHMNGLLELFALGSQEHITVGQVVLPGIPEAERYVEFSELLEAARAESARKGEVQVGFVQAGDSLWRMKGASGEEDAGEDAPEQSRQERFLCLHPSADFSAEGDNAYSACFYMELDGGFSMLLTGDVEGAGERALLDELRRQRIDRVTLLKVAHHGSRGASGEEFLGQVKPMLSVISCGRNNRYGHPHRELLERLEDIGTDVYRTDERGAVTVLLEGRQAIVKVFCE